MRKVIKEFIINLFKHKEVPRCKKCNSKHLNKSSYSRGWNNWLEQACGDTGVRCFDCGYIEWENPLKNIKLPYQNGVLHMNHNLNNDKRY